MEHSSAAVIDQRIFCGFLEMETKANSGVFHRRFLRLNPITSTLEYFADRQQVVADIGSLIFFYFNVTFVKAEIIFLFLHQSCIRTLYVILNIDDNKCHLLNDQSNIL